MHFIIILCNPFIIQMLMLKREYDYRSILLAACRSGQLDIVKYLHKQGFDIHTTHPDSGETSLILAAQSGNLELVKWLVHQNVDVTKVANDGRSALHMAAHEGHIPVMEYLLNLRVDIDIIDEQG